MLRGIDRLDPSPSLELTQAENGDTVVTEDLAAMEEQHGYSIAVTAAGDRYVIVSFLMFMIEEVDGVEQTVVMSMTREASARS